MASYSPDAEVNCCGTGRTEPAECALVAGGVPLLGAAERSSGQRCHPRAHAGRARGVHSQRLPTCPPGTPPVPTEIGAHATPRAAQTWAGGRWVPEAMAAVEVHNIGTT